MKLPSNVYKKFNAYYYVLAQGKKRKWIRLSSVRDGLPAMYSALSEFMQTDSRNESMKKLIEDWQKEVMTKHAIKTQKDEIRISQNLKEAFIEFNASEVQAPDVIEAIKPFKEKPRTYNMYRAMMRELMRYAIEKGYRTDNPVEHIKTMSTPPRKRYVTDSEIRRIKVAAMYGLDGLKTRSGLMICALIDMAYLTGQRISDLLALEWSQMTTEGIIFQTQKTGAKVLIEWTPKLKELEQRLIDLKKEKITITSNVFTTQDGKPYSYSGASTAWKRAVKRAGIRNIHFHDLRAKALTDKDEYAGITAAQRMGGHTTQQQTSEYIRQQKPIKISATR